MIKQFYFAGHLFTILNQFGEQSDEIEMKRKYAKWKAIEIDRCIKNGIPPTPGPPGGMEDEEDDEISQPQKPPAIGFNITDATPPYPGAQPVFPGQQDTPFDRPTPAPRKNIPSPSASYNPPPPPQTLSAPTPVSTSLGGGDVGGVASLSGVQKEQVQKYCKNAISCLDFDDSPGAITFLEKSLKLLKTGRES
jgi:vacuolar protein sorting-associated protein VTA1